MSGCVDLEFRVTQRVLEHTAWQHAELRGFVSAAGPYQMFGMLGDGVLFCSDARVSGARELKR